MYTLNKLKSSRQCSASAAKASFILGQIARCFGTLDIANFRLLYKTYVRPHLEYCVQAWNPYLHRDIDCLEKIQRRATRLVKGFSKKSYEDRLRLLGFTTLQQRRLRGDLIKMYKI